MAGCISSFLFQADIHLDWWLNLFCIMSFPMKATGIVYLVIWSSNFIIFSQRAHILAIFVIPVLKYFINMQLFSAIFVVNYHEDIHRDECFQDHRLAFRKQALAYIFGSSTAPSTLVFCMFLSSVSSRAVVASEVVFSLIVLPILVQSAFKCLGVWCLNNFVWEIVPVACDSKT